MQLVLELVQYMAALPGGSWQWNCSGAVLSLLGAGVTRTPAIRSTIIGPRQAWVLLWCTSTLPRGSGVLKACEALAHCPVALRNLNLFVR